MPNIVSLLKKIAKERGIKYEELPSGVVILINNHNQAFLQITVVKDAYYVRYLLKDSAYLVRRLNRRILEDIIQGTLREDGKIVFRISVQ